MSQYYVYLLRCADASYYAGITNNPERRVWEHNHDSDARHYTFSRRPVTLAWCAPFKEAKDAIRFEKQLKGWSRAKKEALIQGNWESIVRLANQKKANTVPATESSTGSNAPHNKMH